MDVFSNREIAVLVWIALALALSFRRSQVRQAAKGVGKSLLHRKVLTSILLLFCYVSLLVAVAHRLDVWQPVLLKDTIYWVLTVGIAFLSSVPEALKAHSLWEVRKAFAFKVGLVGAFLINYYVFPLIVELALIPFVVVVLLASTVADQRPEVADSTKIFFDSLAALVGIALAIFGIVQFVAHVDVMVWSTFLQSLALPIWLTLGLLPFIYAAMMYAGYDHALITGKIAKLSRCERWRTILVLATTLHFKARTLASLRPHQVREIAQARSFRGARQYVRALAVDEGVRSPRRSADSSNSE